jgi:hypothetical protein
MRRAPRHGVLGRDLRHARFDLATASAKRCLSRDVSSDRAGTSAVTWVNDRREHVGCGITDAACAPQRHLLVGDREITNPYHGPVLHTSAGRPAVVAQPLACKGFNDDLDHTIGDTDDVDDTDAVHAEQQRRSVVDARGLAAVGCRRQSACRGHEPHSRIDTPLKYREPLCRSDGPFPSGTACSNEILQLAELSRRRSGRFLAV